MAQQIEEMIHECVLMHALLRDERPLTDLEYQLLNAHLQSLVVELALKKSRQDPIRWMRVSRMAG